MKTHMQNGGKNINTEDSDMPYMYKYMLESLGK